VIAPAPIAGALATARRALARGPLRVAGVVVLAGLLIAGAIPGVLVPHDPYEINARDRLLPPSRAHLLGTDDMGRDILARIIHGTRVSVAAALALVALAAVVGSAVGLVAGYAGRRTDELVMRAADVFLSFPQLILAIGVVTALGRGIVNCVLALSLVWWAQYARLMRGQVLVLREKEFVVAARALGQRHRGILVHHLLPNAVAPVLVKATVDMGLAIIFLSALSFLGLGIQPPDPEWGSMIALGRKYLLDYWWYPTFPGLTIFLTVLGFNVVAEWIKEDLVGAR
jgi:peptide/nickel transport system permease protein